MSNSETAHNRRVDDESEFWRCFDALPKKIRVRLTECHEDYSAVDVYNDYQSRRSGFMSVFGDPAAEALNTLEHIDNSARQQYRTEMRFLHIGNIS